MSAPRPSATDAGPPRPAGRWHRALLPRDIGEAHRTSTPLELLFDLCVVVAVSQAGGQLHHAVAEGHYGRGVLGFLLMFFALWWAWMNFTWFASAYDNDDVPYRLATFVQIAGALVIAAGVPRAFDGRDLGLLVAGYVVMRISLVLQWLRAAAGDPTTRPTAVAYAIGVTLCQVGWVCVLLLPGAARPWASLVLIPAELVVPLVADVVVPRFGTEHRPTTWHPEHIAERYGLFTLIVLGECVLAATTAVQAALDTAATTRLYGVAGGGLLIVFSMWWLYFTQPASELLTGNRMAFRWGYGHYFILGSAAAVGEGLAVAADQATHASGITRTAAGLAVGIPVAVYLLTLWVLHLHPHHMTWIAQAVLPVAAAAAIGLAFTAQAVWATGLVLVAAVVVAESAKGRTAGKPSGTRAVNVPDNDPTEGTS